MEHLQQHIRLLNDYIQLISFGQELVEVAFDFYPNEIIDEKDIFHYVDDRLLEEVLKTKKSVSQFDEQINNHFADLAHHYLGIVQKDSIVIDIAFKEKLLEIVKNVASYSMRLLSSLEYRVAEYFIDVSGGISHIYIIHTTEDTLCFHFHFSLV